MNIDDIIIGTRHRRDMGDIDKLAENIKEIGLLQPVGVTSDKRLVFGQRRILAYRKLGWTEIETREIDIGSITAGEYAENEMREDFTPSERVAIMETIQAEIGNRQGQRTDQLVARWPQVPKDAKTRDIAAKQAGFASEQSARRAKNVVKKGVSELVDAMDTKALPISTAADIAQLPREEQPEALARATTKSRKPYKARGSSKTRPKMINPPRLGFTSVANREGLDPNQRVHLWEKKHKDVIDAAGLVMMVSMSIGSLAGAHQPEPEAFMEAIAKMLAWKRNAGATDGSQTDYARKARQDLEVIRKNIETAYRRVSGLRQLLNDEEDLVDALAGLEMAETAS